MKNIIIALSFIALSSAAGEYETTVGFGHQYGGVLGAQFSYKTESSEYYGSLGLVGYSAGIQTTFSQNSKHAFGLVAGRDEIQSSRGFLFVTYDYHLNGFSGNGWVVGTGLGYTLQDGIAHIQGDSSHGHEIKAAITLNVGYKF